LNTLSNIEPLELIVDPPAFGAWNMGIDEMLMERAAERSIATLRFYEWAPATLSLGYFQNAAERAGHAASSACDLVRRSSGGGAILHDRELTYSISLPTAHPLAADAETLYRRVHGLLLEVLAEFGIAAELNEHALVQIGGEPFLCFERRSVGDVVLRGFKICGSAQRRRRGAILQHGSILLARSAAAPELPGIADLSGRAVSSIDLRSAWIDRWQRTICPLRASAGYTEDERISAKRHIAEKYGTETWTNRR
jgi:lipoate-protein ligase A